MRSPSSEHTNTRLFEDILLVNAVNMLDLLSSVLANIMVPAIALKTDFANYRLLVLYSSYAGFVHLGILNSLYLYVLGKNIGSLDFSIIVASKRILLILHAVLLPLSAAVMIVALPGRINHTIVLASVAMWAVLNSITFFNYIFQGTGHFRAFAIVNLFCKSVGIAFMAYLVLTRKMGTINLMIAFILPAVLVLGTYEYLWCTGWFKKGDSSGSGVQSVKTAASMWPDGLVLYFANICISMVFSLGCLFASVVFSAVDFAEFAFAYGFTSVAYLAIDGLTSAVIPHISRRGAVSRNTGDLTIIYSVLVWLAPLSFWICRAAISRFFPQYGSALQILKCFSATLPLSIIIRTKIVALATAMGKQRALLKFSLPSLLILIVTTTVLYLVIPTKSGLALGWSLAIIFIGIMGGLFFTRQFVAPDTEVEYSSTFNAIFATVAFALTVNYHACTGSILYGLCIIVAIGIVGCQARLSLSGRQKRPRPAPQPTA